MILSPFGVAQAKLRGRTEQLVLETLSEEQVAQLRKKEYNATVSWMHRVHEELIVLRVRPDFPLPSYKAGQYTTLGLGFWEPRLSGCQPEAISPKQLSKVAKRAYSISSPMLSAADELLQPDEEDFLEFYIVLVSDADKGDPTLTPRLFALQEGSRLFVGKKITGHYTLDPVQPDDTVLLMATGTGEAPHNSMLQELLRHGHRGKIVSVVCVRYQRDLAYLDAHRKIEARMPSYTYITLTTREEWNRKGKLYIQDLVATGQLEERLGGPLDPSSTHVFLCGNPKMIGAPQKGRDGRYIYPQLTGVIEVLEGRGFKADRPREPGNIHFEKYW